jgi:hypothetical protein
MSTLDSILFLLLFIMSNFFARVMLPLMLSLTNSLLFDVRSTLFPQLSLATCQSCKDQKTALELCRTYDFLTRHRDEFEPLHAQLLAHHPYVSLMDALVEVCNGETHLQDAGLLRSSSVLAAHSSIARLMAPAPLVSTLVALPAARGESGGLHCDHCGWDGHVEAFCYMKKKAQKA